jgi:hypothetical protein
VKEPCWWWSQVTREGFAETSSVKGVAGASKLVQVEFLTLDKVNFSSKSEYDLSVILASVDQYLGKSE